MTQYDTYGAWWWPFSDSAWSELKATVGYSAGKEVYDNLDTRFLVAPKGPQEAYDHAAYWLSVAAARADYEGEKEAQNRLFLAMQEMQTARADNVGVMCSVTGLGCGENTTPQILQSALDEIEHSGLNQDDRIILTSYIKKSKNAVAVRRALPKIAIAAVGIGVIFLVVRRSQRERTQDKILLKLSEKL